VTDACDVPVGVDTGFLSPGSNAPRGTAWTSPASAHDEVDGTVATGRNGSGTRHDWSNLGVAISAAGIDGITVQVEHSHKKDRDTGIYTCQLIDDVGSLCGSTRSSVDHGHQAEATETLGGPTDTWGCALTEAIVENANFGISCYYTRTTGGGGNLLRVDEWHVKVHFAAAASCGVDADCDDALFCNGAESCVTGVCQSGTAPTIDDGVACTDDSCDDVLDIVVNVANDGNCDNGLFCDGTETCDPVLDCQSGNDPCPGQSCDEPTDTCTGCLGDGDCDDGLFCNGAETCAAGTCQAGTAPSIDDGVTCTDDSCDEVLDVVVNTPNHGLCDNGLFCDGAETCDAVLNCQAGTAPSAADGVACTDDSCDETLDIIVNTVNDGNCDDALFCNGSETCDAVSDCQSGTAPLLSDGVGCTDDSCDEALDIIVNTVNDGNCDDALFCNGSETCDAVSDCQSGTAPLLGDGVACTDDSCDEALDIIVNTVNDGNCDDALFCNGSETCDAVLDCQSGTVPVIDDGVACTEDSCDETLDIVVNAVNNASCDNSLFCDGAEICDPVLNCQPGTTPVIDDGVACTDDSCDEVNDVVVNTVNNANCDNTLFCDGAETCDAALDCQAGVAPVLSDGVGCTDDSCDEVNDVVVNTANDANCDNTLFCDGAETCDAALDCQTGSDPCPGQSCWIARLAATHVPANRATNLRIPVWPA